MVLVLGEVAVSGVGFLQVPGGVGWGGVVPAGAAAGNGGGIADLKSVGLVGWFSLLTSV